MVQSIGPTGGPEPPTNSKDAYRNRKTQPQEWRRQIRRSYLKSVPKHRTIVLLHLHSIGRFRPCDSRTILTDDTAKRKCNTIIDRKAAPAKAFRLHLIA